MSGFSGHRLTINHLTQPFNQDVEVKEICSSFPYAIGPSLPRRLKEPWITFIDTGAVTSIAPSSFAPHVPIIQHSGQLVTVNGGEIKVLVQKLVMYIARNVVMNIAFLIVEDVVNPIIGLDVLHMPSGHDV